MIHPNIIPKEEIIEVGDYFKIPGSHIFGHYKNNQYLDEPPNKSVVVMAVDDLHRFVKMYGNNNKEYVVVASASDFGPSLMSQHSWQWDAKRLIEYIHFKYPTDINKIYQFSPSQFINHGVNLKHKYAVRSQRGIYYSFEELPSNIIHLYTVNPYLYDKKITPIPFGIPDGNRDIIYQVMQENTPKNADVYVNVGMTNPLDREWVLKGIREGKLYENGEITWGEKVDPLNYYREIARHMYCLCPPGNGMDTYKMSESLYLGTIPLVHWEYVVDAYEYIYEYYNGDKYNVAYEMPETLKMSYWKEKLWKHFS